MNTTVAPAKKNANKKKPVAKKKPLFSPAPRSESSMFAKKKKVVVATPVIQEVAPVIEVKKVEVPPAVATIMEKVTALPVEKGRRGRPGVHNELLAYKESIQILRDKDFTAKDIADFLNKNGFELSYAIVKNFIDTEWPEAIKKRVKTETAGENA